MYFKTEYTNILRGESGALENRILNLATFAFLSITKENHASPVDRYKQYTNTVGVENTYTLDYLHVCFTALI